MAGNLLLATYRILGSTLSLSFATYLLFLRLWCMSTSQFFSSEKTMFFCGLDFIQLRILVQHSTRLALLVAGIVVFALVASALSAPQFNIRDGFRLLTDGFGSRSGTVDRSEDNSGSSGGLGDALAALIGSQISGRDNNNNNNNGGQVAGGSNGFGSLEDGLRFLASQGPRVAGVIRQTPDGVIDGVTGIAENAAGTDTRLPRLSSGTLGDLVERGSKIIQDNPKLALSLIMNLVNRNSNDQK
eukprot:maker-scaffold63_size435493-snap-gene-3.32 protein:Tk00836 transcript:maker-scaffold63_size435493-snap-gene-3.32-mRNA-1 annotation:"hypothetical protein YYG_05159"